MPDSTTAAIRPAFSGQAAPGGAFRNMAVDLLKTHTTGDPARSQGPPARLLEPLDNFMLWRVGCRSRCSAQHAVALTFSVASREHVYLSLFRRVSRTSRCQ